MTTTVTGNLSGQPGPTAGSSGMFGVLSATELEWATLPAPFQMFLHEAGDGLVAALGVVGDG